MTTRILAYLAAFFGVLLALGLWTLLNVVAYRVRHRHDDDH